MKRYLKLYLSFIRNCLVREMEFRLHFLVWAAVNVAWTVVTLVAFDIIYGQTETIAGWKEDEVLVLLGVYFIIQSLLWGIMYRNINSVSRYVNRGELDLILVKPVDSQFFVSTRYFGFHNFLSPLLGLVVIGIGLHRLTIQPTILQLILFFFLLMSALVICYSVWFISVTLTFWVGRLDNIQEVFISAFDLARVPGEIYKGAVGFLLTFIVPLALVTTLPARVLLGAVDPYFTVFVFLFATLSLSVSRLFWNFALKHYTSAGG